ncbi:ArsR/SmtB family transcription factor [Promicromonospora sp. NPDC057138]|uniref:ArsR/SmtB family transcription factor n=1 Tax=Promicromonospora sp. NPDC057138 TaxID=3346031 RepID=UPI00363C826A
MNTQPLYRIKADLFKALAHPLRIQVLEVLAAAPGQAVPVTRLAAITGAEASTLSQHLGVLKNAGVVVSTRSGNAVDYRLAEPVVSELLVVARAFLLSRLSNSTADTAAQLSAARHLPPLPGANAQTLLRAVREAEDQPDQADQPVQPIQPDQHTPAPASSRTTDA